MNKRECSEFEIAGKNKKWYSGREEKQFTVTGGIILEMDS